MGTPMLLPERKKAEERSKELKMLLPRKLNKRQSKRRKLRRSRTPTPSLKRVNPNASRESSNSQPE